jgi:excisionase family DNA binding protein
VKASMTRHGSTTDDDSGDPIGRRQSASEEMRFFTIAAVAEFFGVTPRTVRRWIKSGELVAHHFGSVVRIAESDLKAFIARHRDP